MLGFIAAIFLSFAMGGAGHVSTGQTQIEMSDAPKILNRELPMPLDQIKNIINLTKGQWVAYRDWDGKQLIYFTHLESWKCGISQVKFGLNGDAPNQVWNLDECDISSPNVVTKDMPYLVFEPNQVQLISLQLTFDDGSQTEIIDFAKP